MLRWLNLRTLCSKTRSDPIKCKPWMHKITLKIFFKGCTVQRTELKQGWILRAPTLSTFYELEITEEGDVFSTIIFMFYQHKYDFFRFMF